MNIKKHILILTPGFPADENDTTCIPPLQDFLLKFKQAFPYTNFTIATFQYPFDKSFYKWNGFTVFGFRGKNSKLEKLFVWDNALTLAKYLHEKNKLDVVHSLWLGECAMIGNRISSRFNIKHICTLMGQDVSAKNPYLKLLNKNRMTIVSLSENQTMLFKKLTNRDVDAKIFWGVSSPGMEDKFEREIDLLGVGSLIPLKNYELMIETIKVLKKDFPDIKCKLIGDGNQFKKLKKLCTENNLNNNLEFLGKLSRENVFKYMRRSKILFHPSLYEGSGLVFAEALANGLYISSFNVGYAHNTPKWKIANNENEIINNTKELLHSNLIHQSNNIFPIEETVKRYAKLYGIIN